MEKQDFDSKQRFSLRKLSIGLSSILVGMTFFGVQLSGSEQVHAATADTNTQSQNNGQAEQGNNKPGAETQTFVLPKREKSAVDALSSLAAQKDDATGDVITDNDDGSITIGEEPGLDPNTHDPVHETHDIDYQGASQSTTIHYKDGSNTEVGKQTVTGKTGETTNVNSEYPKGWISDNPAQSVDYQGATTPGGSDSKATVTYKDGSQKSSNIQYGEDHNGSSEFDVTVRHRVDGSQPGKGGLTQSDGQPAKTTTSASRQIEIDDSNLTEAERAAIKLNGKSVSDSANEINRTVNYERQAAIDAITGKVDITKNGKLDDGTDTEYTNGYSAWTVKSDSPNKDFDAVAITGPKGYAVHITKDGADVGSIEAQDVIASAGQTHVYRVTFVAKDGSKKIHFVMDNGHGQTTDAVMLDPSDPEHKKTLPIPDATISGKSDQPVSPNSVIPEGWVADTPSGSFGDITIPNDPAEQEKPIQLKIKHGSHDFGPDSVPNPGDTTQGDHTKPGDGKPSQDVTYYDTHLDLTQTVTGISQTDPSAKDTQSIQFVRGFTVDDVTGAVTFKDWQAKDPTKDKFTSVTATAKDGYSAHLDDGEEAKSATDEVTFDQGKLNSLHDAIGSTGEHKEAGQFNHHFTYTANNATQNFHFVGEDGEAAKNPDGTPIEADVENGVTDGKAVAKIPDGWTVVSAKYDGGSDIPVEGNTVSVTFAPEGQGKDVTITIKHGVDHHGPDELPNPGDKTGGDHTKPGDGKSNHEITYYDTHLDLTQTVTGIDQANSDAKDTQEIHFTRGFSIDQVTGEVHYDAWQAVDPAKNKFTSVSAKAKDGYSAHLDGKPDAKSSTDEVTFDETKLNGLHDAIGSDGANKDQVNKDQFTHSFTYTANESHQNITFYDQDNHDAQVGDGVTLHGKTDEEVGVTIPSGYDVVSARDATGKDVTDEIKSGKITLSPEDSSSDITVTVSQHKDVIGPTDTTPTDPTGKDAHPNNPGGKKNDPTVPSDPTGPKLKADVDYDSLHRMVTQTVTKYGTDGTALPDKDVQTVYYERSATINRATGDVTYGEWVAVNNFTDNQSTGAKTGFDRVALPDVAGYKSSAIEAWTPTQEQLSGYKTAQDLPKDLRYNANAHDVVYKFIDDDDNGKQIGSDITIHGVTDETLNQSQLETFGLKMPDPSEHYVLAQGQSIPTSYTFAADPTTPVEIHFKHETKTITPDDIPTGTDGMPKAHTKGQGDQGDHDVTKDDFSKTIGRTITVNVPTGTVTVEGGKQTVASEPQDHSQTTTLTRTGTYDMRTGEVTWGDWTHGKFDEFDVPAVPGYTPSQTKVDGVGDVGPDYVDPKVDITYTANEGSQPIHFVDKNGKPLDPAKDKDDNGNPVNDGSATGVTDQTVTVTVPEGWKLVDPKDGDTKIPAPGEDGQIPAKDVKIEHDVTPVDHDHPKTPGDPVDPKKPNGPTNGDGMTSADLNQVAIREIHVTFPANYTPSAEFLAHAKATGDHTYTITQKIGYYRDALQDKVTGKLAGYRFKNSDGTFTDIMLDSDAYKTNHGWMFDATTSSDNTYTVKDGVAHFNQISIPSIQGYSAHIAKKPTTEIVDSMSGLKRTRSLYFVSFMALPRPTQKDQTVEDDKGVGEQSVTPANKKEAPAKEVPENPIISGKKVVKGVPAPTTPSEPKKPEKPQQPTDTSNTGAVPDVPGTPEQPTQPTEASQPTQPSAPVQTSQATDGDKQKPAQKKTNKKGKVVKKNKKSGKNTNKNTNKNANKRANGYGKGNRQGVVAPGVGNSQNATKQLANTNSGKTMKHAAVSQSAAKSDSGKLPQTGNKQSGFAMILGAIASTLGLFGLAKTKRKHD